MNIQARPANRSARLSRIGSRSPEFHDRGRDCCATNRMIGGKCIGNYRRYEQRRPGSGGQQRNSVIRRPACNRASSSPPSAPLIIRRSVSVRCSRKYLSSTPDDEIKLDVLSPVRDQAPAQHVEAALPGYRAHCGEASESQVRDEPGVRRSDCIRGRRSSGALIPFARSRSSLRPPSCRAPRGNQQEGTPKKGYDTATLSWSCAIKRSPRMSRKTPTAAVRRSTAAPPVIPATRFPSASAKSRRGGFRLDQDGGGVAQDATPRAAQGRLAIPSHHGRSRFGPLGQTACLTGGLMLVRGRTKRRNRPSNPILWSCSSFFSGRNSRVSVNTIIDFLGRSFP